MPYFVEVVLVQLAHEAGKVAVLEVFREDVFRKLLVLFQQSALSLDLAPPHPQFRNTCLEYDETVAFVSPAHHTLILGALQHPTGDIGVSRGHRLGRIASGVLVEFANLCASTG